ncbi:hypothetical protein MP228_012980 [Amoeboaphelidium protococcarum]|nr:hypothetical protein MP228_012980 [Amoeboaphelidium protococcarum]
MANLRSLQVAPCAELTCLRKEKDRLMEEKILFTRQSNHQEVNSRVHSDITETFENMARIDIQGHLRRLFGVGYREDIGFITKGASLSNSVALGLLKQLYPDFKRQKSGQADILLYLDKPNGSWSIDGNDDDRFVSIGKDDDVDFSAALESLNYTTPVCQITPPPSQEDLDKDSTLVYKSNASFYALFEASTKKKWYLDKREQLELQLAYLGLKYLIAQDELFVCKPLDAKRVELAQIVPRLAAFAGFSSFDSYQTSKKSWLIPLWKPSFLCHGFSFSREGWCTYTVGQPVLK